MDHAKKLFSLFLALALLLGIVSPALAQDADGAVYSALVLFEDGADSAALWEQLENTPGISVRWRYSALLHGAAIEGTAAALALAEESAGVRALALSRTWTQAETITDPLSPTNSLDGMNALAVEQDGDGMVIAVLDSGVKLSHEAFADWGIMDEIRITEEMVKAFADEGGTQGRYVSAKIPFAYDYSDDDRSVHTSDEHGTHVSALAAGYAQRADGSVKFRGVAPAAQLLCMKVFPDDAKRGAEDADILKAMEDAYLLGADVINLSLGMLNGYLDDPTVGAVYAEVFSKLEAEGVVVCCAVGNYATALTGKAGDAALPGGAYTDYATVCAPAIFDGAAAIAAVNSAFYEAGGGIIAGERTILYTETVSEVEGTILPDIRELAGRTMEYAVIGGLGAEEDFAGLDLTGCAALVQRGELYFSEKVQNAAAAGAELCIIYNNEPGFIRPAVDHIPIPCVMITAEDGTYLVEQAENGRGTLAIAPDRMNVSTGETLTMLDYSSWGATADLRLAPTLSAPGGTILSAGIEADNAYTYLSGTSMAAPNAAGAYALLLQALKERGVEDQKERADLAAALLESTARFVTDESGVPLSPRRQGAGVIDLAAALAAEAVIQEPILEAGESGSGQFRLQVTVQNLSDREKVFQVDSTVLTDAFTYAENRLRSMLTPLDITNLTALSGAREVRVAPMGERTITLTLTVTSAAQALLREVYPNGFFTEGYITLTDEEGESIHATFLGYCGDWEAAPIIEQVDFRDVMNAYYEETALGTEGAVAALSADMGYNYAILCGEELDTYGALLLGENPFLVTRASDARIAMSTSDSDAIVYNGDRFVIDLFTLRNAERIIMVISDRNTGEIYRADDRAYVTRSSISETVGAAASSARFIWDGRDANGGELPSGTAVTVRFYAWLESDEAISDAYAAKAGTGEYGWLLSEEYESYAEWSFPLVLDGETPRVSCRVEGDAAVITVTDGHFVAYAAVQDETGAYLAREGYEGEMPGAGHTLTIPLAECSGETLYVTVADYAGNMAGFAIDLAQPEEVVRCAAAMLTDVEKNAWYHEAVDFVIERELMSVGDGLTFSPEDGALRIHALQMLYDLAGQPAVAQGAVKLPFSDVPAGASYRMALEWAYSEGIVTGYDNAQFGAFAPIQRAQIAVMLYRAAIAAGESVTLAAGEAPLFRDGLSTPDWAADALDWAAAKGYLVADDYGRINAREYLTRAEFAYILMKLYEEWT